MPLPDGTNAEKEDPSPPLGWTSKADLKDVVLYQMIASPPCAKLRLMMTYYGVPFEVKNHNGGPIKKGGSYKLVPVLVVSGRQVNDSYIIMKHLTPVLAGSFDQVWEDKITFKLQVAIELEAFTDTSDLIKFAKLAGFPGCLACCIAPCVKGLIAKKIREKHPDLPPSKEVGREFKAAMGNSKFFGGEKPGPVDISYFGTLAAFIEAKTAVVQHHLDSTGLREWWDRMNSQMPKIF
mmetsp:Transcript_82552/g.191819  ORF Transcript_82552/g.191819 Transcript_82552/m.191819 type:complete len:236 (+) Transcript_82552:51-758(+)